jgi:hypothetical protein
VQERALPTALDKLAQVPEQDIAEERKTARVTGKQALYIHIHHWKSGDCYESCGFYGNYDSDGLQACKYDLA